MLRPTSACRGGPKTSRWYRQDAYTTKWLPACKARFSGIGFQPVRSVARSARLRRSLTQQHQRLIVDVTDDVPVTRAQVGHDVRFDVDAQAVAGFDGCGLLDDQCGQTETNRMVFEEPPEGTSDHRCQTKLFQRCRDGTVCRISAKLQPGNQ